MSDEMTREYGERKRLNNRRPKEPNGRAARSSMLDAIAECEADLEIAQAWSEDDPPLRPTCLACMYNAGETTHHCFGCNLSFGAIEEDPDCPRACPEPEVHVEYPNNEPCSVHK